MNNDKDPRIVNPYSTANGGVTFEQLVGASYLVSLLAGHMSRGLDRGITKEVRFQRRWSQCLLDDIVVVSSDKSRERKLALQIKHDLTFSVSDDTFARVIRECWVTFVGSSGWEFDQETDRIGIGIGIYNGKVDKHFQPLLEWARTSSDATEFLEKISTPSFSSDEKRDYVEIIRNLLTRAKGSDIADDELWRFLKCLVVIHFDLENSGSRDSQYCWNHLLDQLKIRDQSQATTLFDTLTSVVAGYSRSAGSLDLNTLRAKISVDLKDYPGLVPDLDFLRRHSDTVLDSIRSTIGGKVRLTRSELVDDVEIAIRKNEVVVITGEPMVGKSVLLKLLANRLRSEGEVIALSVDRLSGLTLENFLHNINIQSDFQSILSAIGNSPLRCILVDGLERVLVDEDKKRVLNDLIIAVQRYNNSILSKKGHAEYCWKIVFACRSLDVDVILMNLETRKNLANESLEKIELKSLTDREMVEVTHYFPGLAALVSQEHLKEILSRPLVLDILTLPDISLSPKEVPQVLTETWLLKWFWKQVVRLGEGSRTGRGNPDTREQLLIRIGQQLSDGGKFVQICSDMDSEAISGLVSDRLLVKEDNRLRFAHDVFEDWTLAVVFRQETDIPKFLEQKNEQIYLTRAFRLYVLMILEIQQRPDVWLDLLIALEKENTLSPRWYQDALIAPLLSQMANGLLQLVEQCLFADGAILLSKFLKALRTICVQPDPRAHLLLGNLPEEEHEKYLAYLTIPIWEQWILVIQIVLRNIDKLSDECLFEFSCVVEKWMTITKGNQLFRKDIAELSLTLLDERFLRMDSESTLGYECKEELRENLIKSVLWAADCLPDKVSDFVKQRALRSGDSGYWDFEELICEIGWKPLCEYLPETAADVLEAILCEEPGPDRYGNRHFVLMDLGIESPNWHPPAYSESPFLTFLTHHPDEGLNLINRIVNHATRLWKVREELKGGRKPISQTVQLQNNSIEVWGDEIVYNWYRYPSTAPDTVTCALMALEYWMNHSIGNGIDPKEILEKVLKDTESVATVGVCSSVTLANHEKCQEAVLPILENPAFWFMDQYRYIQDMIAESNTKLLSNFLLFEQDKRNNEILLRLARQPHRKFTLRDFVLPILLFGTKETRESLQKTLRSFPVNLFFLYEDERGNERVIRERKEACKIWAAQAELKNHGYLTKKDGKEISIHFELPARLEEKQKEKLGFLEEQQKLYGLFHWSMKILDENEASQPYTPESAMLYVQELVSQDDPSHNPKHCLEDSELRARAIAAFVAALVTRRWEWIEKNDYVSWFRNQLIIAARRPRPPLLSHDQVSIFPEGYRRSAARALPILLSKYPEDRETRETILTMVSDENNEVRAYLFSGLRMLWTVDQKTIWKCIDLVIKSSRRKAQNSRFRYQGASPRKYVHSLSIELFSKRFRDYSPEEIDIHYLQSMLCCLPSDNQIGQIESVDKLINFLEDLLLFTIDANIYYQSKDTNLMIGINNRWNDLLFSIIANALLRLPLSIAEPKFYVYIRESWQKAPVMMEMLLRYLILLGLQPELGDRIIQLWASIGTDVLSSFCHEQQKCRKDNRTRNILGLLIFVDPAGILEWRAREWEPLENIVPLIDKWCNLVGHRPDCFPSLIKLLRSIGFCLVPEYGINWLNSCLLKVNDTKSFFERGGMSTSLAELLNDSWSTYKESIKQKAETFRRFSLLVDMLVEQGEPLAVQLQSRLYRDLRHNR